MSFPENRLFELSKSKHGLRKSPIRNGSPNSKCLADSFASEKASSDMSKSVLNIREPTTRMSAFRGNIINR